MEIDQHSNLVCLVGANGTGKSNLLELIAISASKLGLSHGVSSLRGNLGQEQYNFSVEFSIDANICGILEQHLAGIPAFRDWDGSLTLNTRSMSSNGTSTSQIAAGGVDNTRDSIDLGGRISKTLRDTFKDVHFMFLDSDRAYPKINYQTNEITQALQTEWKHPSIMRDHVRKSASMLYKEWIKYLIAQENQAGNNLLRQNLNARKNESKIPEFVYHLDDFALDIKTVLPHLHFSAIDTQKRDILFNSAGVELAFYQLSGGEREIAFLIGQIDRFKLREGLFLLDEPELHLNPDLIRKWVNFLKGTIHTGQVWLATHSLEAVEVAGKEATFVLERNESTRKVDTIQRLDSLPLQATLSRAVGSPAFSITNNAFVFIEGEYDIDERERFRKLAGELATEVRFIEAGGCDDVVRHIDSIKLLASNTDSGIRIGGVVDRDFRSSKYITDLETEKHVFVLPVHEVENLFLHPPTLEALLKQIGGDGESALHIIHKYADKRFGSWVFQHTMATPNASSLPDIPTKTKSGIKEISWQGEIANTQELVQQAVAGAFQDSKEQAKFEKLLEISTRNYHQKREDQILWKFCEGKEILPDVSVEIGFKGRATMEQAIFALWSSDENSIPQELIELRNYLSNIT